MVFLSILLLGTFVLRMANAARDRQDLREAIRPINSTDPMFPHVICGPNSLSSALREVGIRQTPVEIAEQCRMSTIGVALDDLLGVASRQQGVEARIETISWSQLVDWNGVAVLHVGGNHFVAADPRERSRSPQGSPVVRIQDGDRPAFWWSQDQLEKHWSGTALLISRTQQSESPMIRPNTESEIILFCLSQVRGGEALHCNVAGLSQCSLRPAFSSITFMVKPPS